MKATGMTKEEYYKKSKIGSMDITTVLNYPSLKGEDSCFTDNRLEHKFLGLTSSPRASHPVVPTVGRWISQQY